jgi:NTE family protein
MDSGTKVLALLERLSGGKNIEDCPIPFLCNAVDISSGEEQVFRSGPLAGAMRASMSFPLIFEPFVEGGLCLVDGGIADNMPVGKAREAGFGLGIRRVLAVDTHRWRRVPAGHFKNGINVMLRCFDVVLRNRRPFSGGPRSRADLVLHAVDKSSTFDFSRKRELLALGEAAVRAGKAELDAFFGRGICSALALRKNRDCGLELDTYYEEPGGAELFRRR